MPTATEERLDQERRAWFTNIKKAEKLDRAYALRTDERLTEDERAAIDRFWEPYRQAYPEIDYRSFESFKNRLGRFDARHIPSGVQSALQTYFVQDGYDFAFRVLRCCLGSDKNFARVDLVAAHHGGGKRSPFADQKRKQPRGSGVERAAVADLVEAEVAFDGGDNLRRGKARRLVNQKDSVFVHLHR